MIFYPLSLCGSRLLRFRKASAYQTWPVFALDVPETMHDESVTVLVGSWALQTGMGCLWGFGDLTARPPKLL